jgi:GTP-binding protein
VKASELALRTAETEAAVAKHPAAFPNVLATSSRSATGMAELRAAMAKLLEERTK